MINFFNKKASLALLVGSVVSNIAEGVSVTPAQCFGGFLALDFSLRDFDNYDTFFNEDSFIRIPEAGIYRGPVDMEEYVRFAVDSSYVTNNEYVSVGQGLKTIVDDSCIFYLNIITRITFNTEITKKVDPQDVGFTGLIDYNVTTHKIQSIQGIYTKEFLKFFLADVIDTPQARKIVCDVMVNSCGANIDHNHCNNELRALPPYTDDVYFDGNSQGCRHLHGFLAVNNPGLHCPHTFFEPTPDPRGQVKCQVSYQHQASDFLDSEDLEQFEAFMVEYGMDPELGYKAVKTIGSPFNN